MTSGFQGSCVSLHWSLIVNRSDYGGWGEEGWLCIFFLPHEASKCQGQRKQSREYGKAKLLETVQPKVLRATSAPFHCCKSIYRMAVSKAGSREAIFYGTAFLGWVTVRLLLGLWGALSAARAYRAVQVWPDLWDRSLNLLQTFFWLRFFLDNSCSCQWLNKPFLVFPEQDGCVGTAWFYLVGNAMILKSGFVLKWKNTQTNTKLFCAQSFLQITIKIICSFENWDISSWLWPFQIW